MNTTLKKLSVLSLLACLLAVVVAGCGGGDDDGGDSASSTGAAAVVPADSPVYASVKVRPSQQMADDVNQIARKLAGVDDLGELVVSELNSSGEGDLTYQKDIEPWLGETVAIFGKPSQASLEGSSLDSADVGAEDYGVSAEVTDTAAAESFLDKQVQQEMPDAQDASYEGVDYKVGTDSDDGTPTVIGLIDENLVLTSSEESFKQAVDASGGESILDSERFQEVGGTSDGSSLADMYVDIGSILKSQNSAEFKQTAQLYESFGMNIDDSAILLSVVPGQDEIAVEMTTNLSSGLSGTDASELIGSFPADSMFAFGAGGVGDSLVKTINTIDEEGIPGEVAPGQLKRGLSQSGLDVEEVVGSIEDIGFFLSGDTVRELTGALVITTSDPDSLESSLKTLSTLVGLSGDPSVSALGGGMTGFSVRVPEFRPDPLVVAMQDDRLVISRGVATAKQALSGSGQTLSGSDTFKAAQGDLGDNFLSGFVDPAPIAALVASMPDPEAKPIADYMRKFSYLAFGGSEDGKTGEIIAKLSE